MTDKPTETPVNRGWEEKLSVAPWPQDKHFRVNNTEGSKPFLHPACLYVLCFCHSTASFLRSGVMSSFSSPTASCKELDTYVIHN